MREAWVIGAGGHAKVVIDALRASGEFTVAGVLDDDPGRFGTAVLGASVLGDATRESVERLGIGWAILAIGSNRARAEAAARLDGRVVWASVVHPKAHIAPGARLGEGTLVLAGAIIQPDTTIGAHAILNTACSVDHDCVIGDFAHVAPGAHLAGGVQIGEGVLIGLGSSLLPGRAVGAWATVGAGCVVTRDIPPGVTARGIPAR